MLERAHAEPSRIEVSDFALLKSATRAAIRAAGPIANVSRETRLDGGTLSRAGNIAENNFLPIDDAVRIDAMSGECRIVRTMARMLGYRLVPINETHGTDQALLNDAGEIARESGELVSNIVELSADGHFSPTDAKIVANDAGDVEHLVHRILKRCHGVMKSK